MLKTLLLTLAISLTLIGCGEKPEGYEIVPIPKGNVSVSEDRVQTTEHGARVASKNGVTDAQLAQVDAGITQAFTDARASGWADDGRGMDYGRYLAYIPVEPCILSAVNHVPSFWVRADNYDGSIYDHYNSKGFLPASQQNNFDKFIKDNVGVVYAAEMVLSYDSPMSIYNGQVSQYNRFVVCPDEMVLKNGSDYGSEHALALHYDLDYYYLTATHSVIGHPILPKRSTENLDYYVPLKEVKLPIVELAK